MIAACLKQAGKRPGRSYLRVKTAEHDLTRDGRTKSTGSDLGGTE